MKRSPMPLVHGLVNAGPTSDGRWRFLCLCRSRFTADEIGVAEGLFRDHIADVDEAAGVTS